MRVDITCADSREWLRSLPANYAHACLTDSPYGLGGDLDIEALLADWLAGQHHEQGGGFMARAWDQVPGPDLWREVYRVLRPGGYLLTFAGTRTADLMGIAIRLAGFEMRDTIEMEGGATVHWRRLHCQAQGMPKPGSLSRLIDAHHGKLGEREVVGKGINHDAKCRHAAKHSGEDTATYYGAPTGPVITAPATEDAARWDDWHLQMAPSQEPIIAARKPYSSMLPWADVQGAVEVVEALLWSLSPAELAERISGSRTQGKTPPSIALESATFGQRFASQSIDASWLADMFGSPEAASTFQSIATSCNSIWDVSSRLPSTSTTSITTELITASRTLKSWTFEIMPECTVEAVRQASGRLSPANNVDATSSGASPNWQDIPRLTARERATWKVVRDIANLLAALAEQLSDISRQSNDDSVLMRVTPDIRLGAPNQEPIFVARKPLRDPETGRKRTVAENVLAEGTGGLHIGAVRVGTDSTEVTRKGIGAKMGANGVYGTSVGRQVTGSPSGRWPGNIALVHVPPSPCACQLYTPDEQPVAECVACGGSGVMPGCRRVGERRIFTGDNKPRNNQHEGHETYGKKTKHVSYGKADPDGMETVPDWICLPTCPARGLGEMSGEIKSPGARPARRTRGVQQFGGTNARPSHGADMVGSGERETLDEGGTAARYFTQLEWGEQDWPFFYCPKAGPCRDAGAHDLYWIADPDNGSGWRQITREEWEPMAAANVAAKADGKPAPHQIGQGSIHATVKPTAIMVHLLKLVMPTRKQVPDGDLVVLEPFLGSGTTAVAARLAYAEDADNDWTVLGCDLHEEHCAIARARDAHAAEHGLAWLDVARQREQSRKRGDPRVIEERLRKRREKDAEVGQRGLFE